MISFRAQKRYAVRALEDATDLCEDLLPNLGRDNAVRSEAAAVIESLRDLTKRISEWEYDRD